MTHYILTTLSHYGKKVAVEHYPCPEYNIVTAGEQIRRDFPEYENYMVTVQEIKR